MERQDHCGTHRARPTPIVEARAGLLLITAPAPGSPFGTCASLPERLAAQAQRKRLRARRRSTKRQPPPGHEDPVDADAPIGASPTQRMGSAAEQQARQYLQACGVRILACNLRTRAGELDIIGLDGSVLAFIEVRQRDSGRYGGAAASVDQRKQARLIRTAQYWLPRLASRHLGGRIPPCRFDVIAIQPDGLVWLKHAFCLPSV